jgi:TDG/mug DNA glycosylase family protein
VPSEGKSGAARIRGFPPVVGQRARVLILGSMPGAASLVRNEYYGLPHNAFWRIMGELFGADPDLPYVERLKMVTDHGVALWDVLDSCYRQGSLDSAIDDRTAKTNDFANFFRIHHTISTVFFNGKKAADLFARRISPVIDNESSSASLVTLPSTSPAYASMTYADKLHKWKAVKIAVG